MDTTALEVLLPKTKQITICGKAVIIKPLTLRQLIAAFTIMGASRADISMPPGSSDQAVKMALTPYYPEAANAMITRVTKDETVTITVVKKAGSKGLLPVQKLVECKGGKNPAIELYEQIQAQEGRGELDAYDVLKLGEQIDKAIEAGEKQAAAVNHACARLTRAAARPAPVVIQGF